MQIGHQNRYYWIGAIQTPNARGPFKWIPDTGSVDVGLWHAGEPNQVDHRNRQCVDLGVGAQGYKMNDYPCAAALPFLCEKRKNYNLGYFKMECLESVVKIIARSVTVFKL